MPRLSPADRFRSLLEQWGLDIEADLASVPLDDGVPAFCAGVAAAGAGATDPALAATRLSQLLLLFARPCALAVELSRLPTSPATSGLALFAVERLVFTSSDDATGEAQVDASTAPALPSIALAAAAAAGQVARVRMEPRPDDSGPDDDDEAGPAVPLDVLLCAAARGLAHLSEAQPSPR